MARYLTDSQLYWFLAWSVIKMCFCSAKEIGCSDCFHPNASLISNCYILIIVSPAFIGHVHVVDLLLRRGAHVDAVDREMRSALQSAAWQGHADVVRLLIEQDASVNHVCNQGASALGIAAQEGHASVVRVLLAHGADVHHSDLCGRTPARVALKAGHQEVAALIEAYGGNSQSGRSSSSNVSGEGAERTERLERATAAAPRAVPRTLLQPANRDSFAESVSTNDPLKTCVTSTIIKFKTFSGCSGTGWRLFIGFTHVRACLFIVTVVYISDSESKHLKLSAKVHFLNYPIMF